MHTQFAHSIDVTLTIEKIRLIIIGYLLCILKYGHGPIENE